MATAVRVSLRNSPCGRGVNGGKRAGPVVDMPNYAPRPLHFTDPRGLDAEGHLVSSLQPEIYGLSN
jgi:hypothetical protein